MKLTKAEREEVWQITEHLAGMGYNITSVTSQSGTLTVTLTIPLLSSSHRIIEEAMRSFGLPEIFIEAIKGLALQGIAQMEVNGIIGETFRVRTGTGQGCRMSAPLFTIATEPLNRAIKEIHEEKFYVLESGRRVGPRMYADDNLAALNMRTGMGIGEILGTYNEYTRVSGLNVNARKSKIMMYRTSREIEAEVRSTGIQIEENIEYLGIIIGRNMEDTARLTMQKIDIKATIRMKIATAPHTDMLHRTTIVNVALNTLYTHVYMALPIETEYNEHIVKEGLKMLWTKQKEGETVRKRRLVSRKRVEASYEMGGLQMIHPKTKMEGMQLNIVQRKYREEGTEGEGMMNKIIGDIMEEVGSTNMKELVEGIPSIQSFAQQLSDDALIDAEITVKYQGYIEKERLMAEKMNKLEHISLDEKFDYNSISSLSSEAKQKLNVIKPRTLGQAARISGVNPSDISILLVHMGR